MRSRVCISVLSNRVKDLVTRDEVALGTWVTLQDALVAQVLGRAGYDFLVLDMEHGPMPLEAVQRLALGTSTTAALPFVRTAWNDSRSVQVPLDAGVVGAIVPYVNDLATARRVVGDARYPPLGARSRGGLRSPFAFGVDEQTYAAHANEGVLLFVMIETEDALAIREEILALEGLDGVFVGPNDLSASFGLAYPRAWDDGEPALHDGVAAVACAARAAGKVAGILAKDVAMARRCIELGYRFVAVGSDAGALRAMARQTLEGVRGA